MREIKINERDEVNEGDDKVEADKVNRGGS